jgi:hypothetical protein
MVISSFANEKSCKGFFFKFGCIGFRLFWCILVFTYVYSRYALYLLLHILLVAALDIKMRDVPTVSSINSLLSQYCKSSHFFFANFYVVGGGGRQLFALPRLSHGQRPALSTCVALASCPSSGGNNGYMRQLVRVVRFSLLSAGLRVCGPAGLRACRPAG